MILNPEILEDKEEIIIYQGKVNQEITEAFVNLTEMNLKSHSISTKISNKLKHVVIEMLQNTSKHSEYNPNLNNQENLGSFYIVADDDSYYVTTGNYVPNENIKALSNRLDKFNNMDKEERLETYMELLDNNKITDKGGAGLGIIDILRKTGNKIKYSFIKNSDSHSYFTQQLAINKT